MTSTLGEGRRSQVLYAASSAILAIILQAAVVEGYLWRLGAIPLWSRIVLGVSGLAPFVPHPTAHLFGALAALATVVVLALVRRLAPARPA